MLPLGLYVHIPFCASICSYCNFNRDLFDAGLKDRYVRAVQEEIRRVGARVNAGVHPVTGRALARGAAADTIYFGGGTPSLLAPAEIGALVAACRASFDLADDAEITLEANPETVTAGAMAGYGAAGVNRVSMGVQSFRDEELRRLGRIHDAARARDALEATRAAGIENVSLDLMLWLPQQTVEQCLFSVRTLAALQPAHASLYLLELYPNSPLREDMARAGWSLAPDEDAADMYLQAIDALVAAGYEHYEISNFARPGLASRHNLKYWTDGDWLAFGCGAHSTLDGVRWKNVSAADSYARSLEDGDGAIVAERRDLTPAERFEEAVITGLRLKDGIGLAQIQRRYGVDTWQRYGDRLAPLVEAGLLLHERGRLRLTPRGFLLSNEVMSVFIDATPRVR